MLHLTSETSLAGQNGSRQSKHQARSCLCLGGCVGDQRGPGTDLMLGGDAANEAVMLRRLGIISTLCALVGEDEIGLRLRELLNQAGVNTDYLRTTRHYRTTISKVLLDAGGDRTFKVSGEAHRHLQKSDLPQNLLDDLDALSLGSLFTLQDLETDGLSGLLKAARRRHILTFADTTRNRNHRSLADIHPILSQLDYFLPSFDDVRNEFGSLQPEALCRLFVSQGCRHVILKMGAEGALGYDGRRFFPVPAYPAVQIDAAGAGDTFCAAFIASILKGLTLEAAIQNGAYAGARAVECVGAHAAKLDPLALPHPF